jgi:hypothetical protein
VLWKKLKFYGGLFLVTQITAEILVNMFVDWFDWIYLEYFSIIFFPTIIIYLTY